MDRLTLFGLFAVTAMLVCYAFEDHSHWFVLGFARVLRVGIRLRISARRLAVWSSGSHLVFGRVAALE